MAQNAPAPGDNEHGTSASSAMTLIVAGSYLYDQFGRTGALSDLDDAIDLFQQAISLTPDEEYDDKSAWLASLGILYESRFRSTGELSDLEEAIKGQRRAVLLTPEEHTNRAALLNTLGISLESRFGHTRLLSDLEEAMDYKQRAALLLPDGHSDKPTWLNSLGVCFERRFQLTGEAKDLEEAIKNKQHAVLLTPDEHANKPAWLNNLGNSFESRFGLTGALDDLEEAIKNQQRAVQLTPDEHPNKPARLNNLGISFESRFRCTGSLGDLEEAIRNEQQAVLLIPDGHNDKPATLNNLGTSFITLFELTGIYSNLEEGIKNCQQAVSITPDGHADKPGRVNNLGAALRSRFQRLGTLSDLEDAIKVFQQAVFLTPDGHTNKPPFLSNLGACFRSRFGRTGTLSDLEEAIKHQRQAVLLTPDSHINKPWWLNNLGTSLWSRFERTGDPSDIEEAIKNHQLAASLTPDGNPDKAIWLYNLGNAFQSRFGQNGLLSDLEEAINAKRQAVSLTPDGHADKPQRLSNLGISLQVRSGHTGELRDIEDAIEICQQAALLTPDGHADKPGFLSNLGLSLESRYDNNGSPNDLDEAISHFKSAATSTIGSPSLRSFAARRWARLEAKRDPPSALGAYRRAIDLIPQVAWIGDPIATRHSQLNNVGDIPREAAAFAIDTGHPDLALEWLEQGRSVVWNQLLNLRTPTHDLDQQHPDIFAEFTQASQELQNAATRGHGTIPSHDTTISLEEETQRHHRLAEKWDSLVKKIQSLEGFEDFLLPKKISILKNAAESGPIVVINVHQRRCDALVLEHGRGQVLHIPLGKLRYEDVVKIQKSLRGYLTNARLAQRWEDRAGKVVSGGGSRMEWVLETIYSKIVYPILQGLGLTTGESDRSNLPHIWWCPTGLLTFLPLHAACRKGVTEIDGVFNYVVSSYTPTVNALLEARAIKQKPFNRLVGIAMTKTPGQSPLPGAATELGKIAKLFAADSRWRFEEFRNESATGEQVLSQMEGASWIHLACHAVQDVQEPTRSGFSLHDRRLTITDIIAKPIANADLAFLSACETATGDEKASDEAVHITGAMLGAGYRGVIGTMWSVPDAAAPIIAEKVYKGLLAGGEPNSERAAEALYEAVKEMRKSSHELFHFWVPFVHYGV